MTAKGTHHYVFQHCHFVETLNDLKGAADTQVADTVRRHTGDVLSFEKDFAPGGIEEPGDAVEKSCLSCPIGADEPQNFALFHGQVDAVQRHQLTEMHADIFRFQNGHHSFLF